MREPIAANRSSLGNPSAGAVSLTVLLLAAVLNWLALQAVHELGHVVAAWIGGGRVVRVVLHPATISRTDLEADAHLAAMIWAGPMFGGVAPLLIAGLVRWRLRSPAARWWSGQFAGFCLIGNGAYLMSALRLPVGDAAELLRLGAAPALPGIAGAVLFAGGIWVWHRLGSRFGLSVLDARTLLRLALLQTVAIVVIVGLELACSAAL